MAPLCAAGSPCLNRKFPIQGCPDSPRRLPMERARLEAVREAHLDDLALAVVVEDRRPPRRPRVRARVVPGLLEGLGRRALEIHAAPEHAVGRARALGERLLLLRRVRRRRRGVVAVEALQRRVAPVPADARRRVRHGVAARVDVRQILLEALEPLLAPAEEVGRRRVRAHGRLRPRLRGVARRDGHGAVRVRSREVLLVRRGSPGRRRPPADGLPRLRHHLHGWPALQ